MRVSIQFLWVLVRGTLDALLGLRTPTAAVVRTLFEEPDHPLAAKPTLRRTAQLSWRALMTVLTNRDEAKVEPAPAIILGVPYKPIREQYVREFGETAPVQFIRQDNCPNGFSLIGRLLAAVIILGFCCVCLPAPLLFRTNSAFERIGEIARALRCSGLARRLKPERVYFFSAFERNANLIAYLIMAGSATRLIKVPSPNPLSMHYRICLASEFLLTSPLQLPEYEQFREDWCVEKVWLWRTPGHVSFPEDSYRRGEGDGKSIGMLSGGQWQRFERGDYFDDERKKNLRAEEALHRALREYLELHPRTRVTVYPHPSEKADEKAYGRALEVYGERIGKDRVDVLKSSERTHDRFADSDVFCSLWSTSALEALYCGHKLIFTRLEGEPSADEEALAGIHVFDKESLFRKLDECLGTTAQQYFEQHDLLKYRHDYYDAGPRLVDGVISSDGETKTEQPLLINAESRS